MPVDSATKRSTYQNDLAEMQSEYDLKKKKLAAQQEAELDSLKKNFEEKKAATLEGSHALINHIKQKQTEEISKTKESRAEVLKKERMQLHELKQKNGQEFENVREKSNQDYQTLQASYKRKVAGIEKQNEENIENLTNRNDQQITSEVVRGRETYQKVRDVNDKEIKQTREKGQSSLQAERLNQDQKAQRLNVDSKKRFGKQQQSWNERENNLNEAYSQKIAGKKESYRDQLKEQNKRFESVYKKTEAGQKLSLQIQSQNFAKELAEQKRLFLTEAEKYNGKEGDPFYKVQDRGSHINEHSDYYVLEAYVPVHEKDDVKVIIEKDKAVVSGQRAFKEKFADEEKKVASSSYQTFREEFELGKPVIMEGVGRERSGDYVIFTIPKLNNLSDRKINRKA